MLISFDGSVSLKAKVIRIAPDLHIADLVCRFSAHDDYGLVIGLPAKEKAVLENVFLGSRDVAAVAEDMDLSTGHVYRLQQTGIRRIRGMLSRFMKNW